MTFQKQTETAQKFPRQLLQKMIHQAFPKDTITRVQNLSEGRSNINFRLDLDNKEKPCLLRIYLRDKDAAFREHAITKLIKELVPAPKTYYIGDREGYRFAVVEFLPGIPLSKLFRTQNKKTIQNLLAQSGIILAKISSFTFDRSGYFDKKLKLFGKMEQKGFLGFCLKCLKNQNIENLLSPECINKLKTLFDKFWEFFPKETDNHLVHVDFKPSNILAKNIEETWQITGIIDWEFAFAGSSMFDIASMLRYSHKSPEFYKTAFIEGLAKAGFNLPQQWEIHTNLLNLMSLLDLLARPNPDYNERQSIDIKTLIDHFILELEKITP